MIQLTDTLAVTADKYQYIMGTPVVRSRNGKENVELKDPGYYSHLSNAVRAAVSRALRDKVANGEIATLQRFLEEYAILDKKFEEMMGPLEI